MSSKPKKGSTKERTTEARYLRGKISALEKEISNLKERTRDLEKRLLNLGVEKLKKPKEVKEVKKDFDEMTKEEIRQRYHPDFNKENEE